MLFLFIGLILISNIHSSIISLPITGYYIDKPKTSFYFPNEDHEYSCNINTFITESFFDIFFNDLNESNIIKTIEDDSDYKTIYFLYQTTILINNTTLPNYLFYESHSSRWTRYTGLALGYHVTDESFSLVHSLYNNKQIDKKKFAFYNMKNKDNGTLFIGGLPNNQYKSLKYHSIVKVKESLPTWGFSLNSIKYNNTLYPMTIPCIIQTGISNIFISNDIYQFMAEIVMKQEIESNRCEVKETQFLGESSLQKYIYCFEGSNVLNQSIEFTFENMKLELTIRDLYKFNKFPLVYSNGEPKLFHNFDGVILGANFLNLFHYTVFDYDNKQLEFYSDTTKITEILHSNKLRDCLIIFEILISISILQSILLLIIKNNVSL